MTQDFIDTATYADLSEAMGADFVVELVHTFLEDAPNMIASLKQGVSEGDSDAYRRAAHSIKSNAEVFGATSLAAHARQMELSGLPTDPATVVQLETVYADTERSLRALLDA